MDCSTVVLASGNPGKLREVSAILSPAGLSVVAQATLGIAPADEPYGTFVENALAKARHASRSAGLPALADDSGLCVDALDGAPGVFSARFASLAGGEKSDCANNRHLIRALRGKSQRAASYVAVLVYLRSADDPRPIIAEGTWTGEIIDSARGTGGFGYDGHFYLPDMHKTVAELDAAQKNRLSHRAKALAGLLRALRARRGA